MKKLFYLLFVLLNIFIFSSSIYAKNFYPVTVLTGGGTGALDKLSVDDLNDGDAALYANITGTTVTFDAYVFDADGTDAESSPTVIRPNDYSTGGVWRRQPTENLASDGIVVNSSGTPYAVSIAGGTGITVTNGDGTGGNPSIAITSGGVTAALAATVMKTDGWNISLGNDSDAITTGKKILKTVCVSFKHDLEEIGLCTDETSGSITIDVWIDEKGATTGLAEITDADSLFDTASEPTISDASSDNCVAVTSFDSGEDTDIPAGTCYVINVDAASTLTYTNVPFKVIRKD